MPYLEARQATVLKKTPIDSSKLPADGKRSIAAAQRLAVETIQLDLNGHAKVKISGAFGGWTGFAYVFAPHWIVPGAIKSKTLAETLSPPKLDNGKPIRKIVTSKRDYVLQPDASTCQSAAIAMITGGDVWAIRSALMAAGTAGDPYVMGQYLTKRVKEYHFNSNASLNDMREAIDDGYQLITHLWTTGSGHVIKLSGYDLDPKTLSWGLIADDPWAGFYENRWTYAPLNQSGNNAFYSAHMMYAAAIVGQSVDDAARIFARGKLLSSQKGAWLHLIKN